MREKAQRTTVLFSKGKLYDRKKVYYQASCRTRFASSRYFFDGLDRPPSHVPVALVRSLAVVVDKPLIQILL